MIHLSHYVGKGRVLLKTVAKLPNESLLSDVLPYIKEEIDLVALAKLLESLELGGIKEITTLDKSVCYRFKKEI